MWILLSTKIYNFLGSNFLERFFFSRNFIFLSCFMLRDLRVLSFSFGVFLVFIHSFIFVAVIKFRWVSCFYFFFFFLRVCVYFCPEIELCSIECPVDLLNFYCCILFPYFASPSCLLFIVKVIELGCTSFFFRISFFLFVFHIVS